jgi:putative iron-dependent peroxidase
MTPQAGILALGTAEHCYLELDLRQGTSGIALVSAATALTGPLSTTGGVNVVVGFDADIVGPDGFRMPGTQHDAWVWIAGGNRTAVFDNTREALAALRPLAIPRTEVTGWVYQHDRDLTGFIDGTENPSLLRAPSVAIADGAPGTAGGSIALVQQWRHDTDAFESLGVHGQELVIGRTKADSVELDESAKPASSHVARTVVAVDGHELKIFRRNTAYGGVTDHGTMFVGFCREQRPFELMLARMAGVGDGVRDALTRYTTPLSGAYYVIPAMEALARFAPVPED